MKFNSSFTVGQASFGETAASNGSALAADKFDITIPAFTRGGA